MTDGGNKHVFCTIITGLYDRGGGTAALHLSIVQLCHVFNNVLLGDTLSRVCIFAGRTLLRAPALICC